MIIAMMMKLLGGTMVIKNARPKNQKDKLIPLTWHHQGGGIGAFLKMKKGIQQNCGSSR